MNKTSIEWTDFTWNPVTGCHKVSPGCKNCYAETLTNRFAKVWGVKSFRDIVLHEDRLTEPEKNRKKWAGKKVFVCSMSDLFQDDVPFDFISKVMLKIAELPETIFQIPTKRPERALEWYQKYALTILKYVPDYPVSLPRNLWIGTSCENQETANERIPALLQIPVVHFLSCEPLLGPIDLKDSLLKYSKDRMANDPQFAYDLACGKIKINQLLQWVIAGGESGHGARPMHPNWARSLRDQCAAANVPFFFKQWGEYAPANGDGPNEVAVCINGDSCTKPDCPGEQLAFMKRVGKSKAGNLLDGKQHLEFPPAQVTIHIERGYTPNQPPIQL